MQSVDAGCFAADVIGQRAFLSADFVNYSFHRKHKIVALSRCQIFETYFVLGSLM